MFIGTENASNDVHHVQFSLRNRYFQRSPFLQIIFVLEDQVQQNGYVFLKTLVQRRLLHQAPRFQPSHPKWRIAEIIGIHIDYTHSGHCGRCRIRQVTNFKQQIAQRLYPAKSLYES